MMKLKVAIVLEATLGGTRKHIFDLLKNLSKEEFDITFIFSTSRADPAFIEGIETLKLTSIRLINLPMYKSIGGMDNIKTFFKLASHFRNEKYDVIHFHAAIAGFIGRLACLMSHNQNKIFYSPHGGVLHHMKGIKGIILSKIERLLTFSNVHIIAVSSFEKQSLIKHLKISEKKITVIHNGIHINKNGNENDINKKEFCKLMSIELPDEAFVVLYPAIFLPAKGHLNFFQSFQKFNKKLNGNIYILLAGEGPLKIEVANYIKTIPNIKDQVIFLGFRNDIKEWMQYSDLVILPSKSEAFGYVILEAFQSCKPVFATSVGGITDIITNENGGLLFDYENLGEMIDAINNFSTNRENLVKMGKKGYNSLLARFDLNKMIESVATIYRNV